MRILFLLNGYNLRKYRRSLPRDLVRHAEDAGHQARAIATRSLEHFVDCMGRAADVGVDLVFSGGGDGSLYHALNHPAARRVALSPLPLGTINAFLRSMKVDVRDPVRALDQLLGGSVREVHTGIANGLRFACFASFGFDARVIHRNPPALKRAIRAASFGVTGARELLHSARYAAPGAMVVDGKPIRGQVTSCVISRIQNYAGVTAFRVGVQEPLIDAVAVRDDRATTLSRLVTHIGLGRIAKGIKGSDRLISLPGISRIEWSGRKPTFLQLDGEAVTISDANHLTIEVDPAPQRILLPSWI